MAYVAPNSSDFKAYFPELADKGDALILLVLEEAGNEIDTSWVEKDYKWAILWLAAHLLVSRLPQTTISLPGGGGSAAVTGDISAMKVGDSQISFAGGASSGSSGGAGAADASLSSTKYGQRYITLRNRSHAGPRTIF